MDPIAAKVQELRIMINGRGKQNKWYIRYVFEILKALLTESGPELTIDESKVCQKKLKLVQQFKILL